MKPDKPSTDSTNPAKSAQTSTLPRDKDAHPTKTDGDDRAREIGAADEEPERKDDRSKPVAAHNQENREEEQESGQQGREENRQDKRRQNPPHHRI